jgi:hypothetical protein
MWSSGPAGAAPAKFRRGPAVGTVGDGRGSVLGLLGFDLGARLWARGCRGAGTPAVGGGRHRGCQFPARGGSGEKEASRRDVVGARGDGRRAS